jgi:hypothetical protein
MRVSKSKILASAVAAFLLLEGGLRLLALVEDRRNKSDKILFVGDSHARGLGALNASVNGQNTAELLDKLPALLEREHPRALVVMSGEANFWNRRFVSRFLDHPPSKFDFLRRWKTVRLFSRQRSSRLFPDVPEGEYPTVAMRWVGLLNSSPEAVGLPAKDRQEAELALQQWQHDPRSGEQGKLSDPASYGSRAAALIKEGRTQEAHDVFLKGLRENPFYAGGEPPPHNFHRYFSEEEFSSLLAEAMPPAAAAGEKPGLSTIRESFLSDDRILEWAFHDLADIIRLAREHHVPVLLLTYPPDRFSGKETPVNGVIREVSIALETPLSDLSSELDHRWGRGERSRFYEADKLSELGRRDANEIISEALRPL